nr:FMN-binding negative transcriptional regulator [uncultured Mucilaginibacter sp.]
MPPQAPHRPWRGQTPSTSSIFQRFWVRVNITQATDSIDTNVLVIFTEPHAYISPKNYEKVENVPTWNYLAVHAYGKFNILEGEEHKTALLKATITNFEAEYMKQWNSLADQYKRNMMKGIVAFEVVVDDLQAKAKLSQNRSQTERENIVGALNHSDNTSDKDTAAYMALLSKKT